MEFVLGFTLFLLIGFALGNEIFSEETIAAFNFDFENEIPNEKIVSSFNVMDYGAVGNGRVDDSQAFIKAWEGVCGAKEGGTIATLVVPQGKTFLLGGTLIAPETTSWGNGGNGVWINFRSVDNLILDGGGKIDGRGSNWWQPCKKRQLLEFSSNAAVDLLPKRHIAINGCKDVVVSDLFIKAPENSPNTDGIDISDSTNVLIQDSTIETGDDCVAINGGSSFINVIGVNCGPGYGISIGSLGDGGAYDTVEEVRVKNCKFSNTQNGVRIKTFQGKLGSYGLFGKATAIKVSDVTYSDIQGTSASDRAINLNCDNVVGCTNIVMKNIELSSADAPKIYGICNNAHGIAFDVKPKVACLS
ncbi:hypothetical protein V6N13_055116 [Hibiscus sabdariffa]|uniref:Uncharacterized protein n=2 Tax=Hibiscus sabdariffa TaxID=183260 RepID=A0ABR2DW48_9ROSI